MTTMRENLLQNNYIVIEDFIQPERAYYLYEAFKSDSENYPSEFVFDEQCPLSKAKYDYRWFLELLVEKTPHISNILNEPVLPTYSYARIYNNGEILNKHKDRPACECSVTLHLGSDGTPWPIWFTKPNGETVSYELKPGQAIIYLGCQSEHWRDTFTGQNYGQVFLHYVRSRGENWDCYFDKMRNKPWSGNLIT